MQNNAKKVFLDLCEEYLRHPDKYDLYGLDCDDFPVYNKITEVKNIIPGEVIRVKDRHYQADFYGKFHRIFAPAKREVLLENRIEETQKGINQGLNQI